MKRFPASLTSLVIIFLFNTIIFKPVGISAQAGPEYAFLGTSLIANTIPFASSATSSNKRQWIYYPSNFTGAQPGLITKIYFKASAVVSPNFTGFLIRMGPTTLSVFPSTSFITANLDTVLYAPSISLTSIISNWIPITLQTPYPYDGVTNFIVEASHQGYSPGFSVMQTTLTGRSVFGNSGNASGSIQDRLADFGFDLAPSGTDIGLEAFVNLSDTICEGSTTAVVTMKNYGPNALINAKIDWRVNNAAQTTYNWSGNLPVNGTANVTIGSYPFSYGTAYSIKAFTRDPNGTADTINGNDTIIKPEIIIKPSPGLTLQDTLKTICQGDSVMITGTLTGSPPWDILINDGSTTIPVTNITQPQFSYSVAPSSTKTYTLTDLSDATGCTNNSVYNFTVTVQQAPSATISPTGSTAACEGDSVTLMASIGLGFSYQWYLNGTPLPIDTNYVIHAKQGGDYTVKVTSPIGCSNLSAPLQVIIHPLPVVDLGNDTVLYPNQNIMLDAGAGYNSYTWSTGESSQTIVIDSAGTGIGLKTVWVRVTDNYSCPGTDTININFTQHPGISEAVAGGSLQIIPNPSDGMVRLHFNGYAAGGYLIEVFSQDGRVEYKSTQKILAAGEDVHLDLRYLSNGLYIIRITSEDRSEIVRFIINR